jgi:HTH-type transcriptional regulator / antitoxin HigA
MTAEIKAKAKSKNSANGFPIRPAVKKAGKKAAFFNRRKYAALLSQALPVVIASEAEYDQTISEIHRLLRKGQANLSPEEDRLLDLLSTLAENWEEARHPIPASPGHRILQHYMQIRGLRQADLQPILGSRVVTSEIVNGKRSITQKQAEKLGSLFSISPAVFTETL